MKRTVLAVGFAVVLVVLIVLVSVSTYVIREGEQAVITQFGEPKKTVAEAGLYFKTPFIQRVNRLEKRLLPWDGAPENMQTRDKKRIFIDVWARWRISDPMRFYEAVGTETGGYKNLDDLVDSAVRDVIGSTELIEVVRSTNRELRYSTEELKEQPRAKAEIERGRGKIEARILQKASEALKTGEYGMELQAVRIKRVNYIESVRRSVHERMRSERLRIARLFESQAQKERNRILGQMQKELEQITGEMEEKSATIRGKADAEVITIAAEAFGKSPEFYRFLRRLEAYRTTMGEGTRLILSTDNAFLEGLTTATEQPAE